MMSGLNVFIFEQNTPSTSWVITHNLGRLVNVDTAINYSGNLEKALPNKIVADPDLNTITITWTSTQTGKATLF